MLPIRLRDFVEDPDGWLYAVSTYDNEKNVGCLLRYVPDNEGGRTGPSGQRYRKYDFEDAYRKIAREKPAYAGLVQRIPVGDLRRVLRPDQEISRVAASHPGVLKLLDLFRLPPGTVGCTGSLLCGLQNESSDIDMVVYGKHWFTAQALVKQGIADGRIEGMSPAMWRRVYEKRQPAIPYDVFVVHEQRKWNRGQIDGTYFDILYTRSSDNLAGVPSGKGEVCGRQTILATVTDASLAFDNPAVYVVEHESVTKVLSFTHTYSGQALTGETIEACGVLERHGGECWLIVGTTREAKGEYIVSKTLIGE